MRGMLAVVLSTLMTALCWGTYGPILAKGREDMGGSILRPFICLGIAYFVIAVMVPVALLKSRGEQGSWTVKGVIWSLAAGTAGAIGALGVILALHSGGKAIYVMPLIFGLAPVVNTFFTMFTGKTYRQAGPIFFAGLIVVVTGAIVVLMFNPTAQKGQITDLSFASLIRVLAATGVVAVSWGIYGPVLHKGQMAMLGSRLRPLICVGLAYFALAVILAAILLVTHEKGEFNFPGISWSLAGGSTGAIGALGIILAFTFGGKPVYVMPLVFGLAPVINTMTAIIPRGAWGEVTAPFYAGLFLVIAGAATVLVFAPKGHGPAVKPAK